MKLPVPEVESGLLQAHARSSFWKSNGLRLSWASAKMACHKNELHLWAGQPLPGLSACPRWCPGRASSSHALRMAQPRGPAGCDPVLCLLHRQHDICGILSSCFQKQGDYWHLACHQKESWNTSEHLSPARAFSAAAWLKHEIFAKWLEKNLFHLKVVAVPRSPFPSILSLYLGLFSFSCAACSFPLITQVWGLRRAAFPACCRGISLWQADAHI